MDLPRPRTICLLTTYIKVRVHGATQFNLLSNQTESACGRVTATSW